MKICVWSYTIYRHTWRGVFIKSENIYLNRRAYRYSRTISEVLLESCKPVVLDVDFSNYGPLK
jgi:hypothetical protein